MISARKKQVITSFEYSNHGTFLNRTPFFLTFPKPFLTPKTDWGTLKTEERVSLAWEQNTKTPIKASLQPRVLSLLCPVHVSSLHDFVASFHASRYRHSLSCSWIDTVGNICEANKSLVQYQVEEEEILQPPASLVAYLSFPSLAVDSKHYPISI